ncbi:glycoside hydrolase family 18 protein [Karstenula rhodostoma CBS 690.94]|uniref:chitinase n=1 Tax=Karstenula rhodostoma CBS 690.94 TaxID=1392251 RepID=A0A9P4U8N2_9PLEO|nr:glycoside hydrolase family 18 protein [Karstenula rhodostoma CBS 690.94]
MIPPVLLFVGTLITYYLTSLCSAELTPNGQNLFVYFSQSSGKNVTLIHVCKNPAVDVVILGFVRDFDGTGGYPSMDFGPANCNTTRPLQDPVAPGLARCNELGRQVKWCQGIGKKVFVSIGGSISNTTFETGSKGHRQAKWAAKVIWNLFGAGTDMRSLRPLGWDVVVDGFDIDHEEGSSNDYHTFVSELRSYRSSASKPIYLSAAPGCTFTSSTLSKATLALVDFIFIRYYNSADCAIGMPGFPLSLKEWYEKMVPSPFLPFPKVLLGGLSFYNGNKGYVTAESFRDAVLAAKQPNFTCWWNAHKFGGVMLWDGVRGLENEVGPGVDFLTYVKDVLDS